MKTIILLITLTSFTSLHSAKAQTISLVDCGLTYFYDGVGNRVLRMIVPCGQPSGKIADTSQTAANTKEMHTDSNTLAIFQIVMIAPNPTAGPLNITCNQNMNNANVIVMDMNGKIVSQTTANGSSIQMDISHLVPGAYNVVVTSNGTPTAKTILKTSK
jgi:hypothetical protein